MTPPRKKLDSSDFIKHLFWCSSLPHPDFERKEEGWHEPKLKSVINERILGCSLSYYLDFRALAKD